MPQFTPLEIALGLVNVLFLLLLGALGVIWRLQCGRLSRLEQKTEKLQGELAMLEGLPKLIEELKHTLKEQSEEIHGAVTESTAEMNSLSRILVAVETKMAERERGYERMRTEVDLLKTQVAQLGARAS